MSSPSRPASGTIRTSSGSCPGDEVHLEVPCELAYELERAMPTAPAGPLTPRVDFRRLRVLGEECIDDLLTGRIHGEPVRFVYPGSGLAVSLGADPIFEHFVVYVPQGGKPFFAVEPVTNANDGFNLHERGIPGSGVFVLEPGEERTGEFWLTTTAT